MRTIWECNMLIPRGRRDGGSGGEIEHFGLTPNFNVFCCHAFPLFRRVPPPLGRRTHSVLSKENREKMRNYHVGDCLPLSLRNSF